MSFELPQLGYAYDALEPIIDAETMEIHYTKHHATYTSKLNAVIEGTIYNKQSIEEILKNIDHISEWLKSGIRNNGGGYYNHKLFWEWMCPGGKAISPEFSAILAEQFTSFQEFQELFSATAASRFGSGWAWLAKWPDGLEIYSTPNQDNPVMEGKTPILWLDVWEHAYYLKYQNRRPDYIDQWWSVVNWSKVEEMYHEYEV